MCFQLYILIGQMKSVNLNNFICFNGAVMIHIDANLNTFYVSRIFPRRVSLRRFFRFNMKDVKSVSTLTTKFKLSSRLIESEDQKEKSYISLLKGPGLLGHHPRYRFGLGLEYLGQLIMDGWV
jgi:hypothetical protein